MCLTVPIQIRISTVTIDTRCVSPRDRDEETGKFSQQYEQRAFLEAIDMLGTPTTMAIAESVGCSYDLAYRRLNTLENEGVITKDEIGGTFLWRQSE